MTDEILDLSVPHVIRARNVRRWHIDLDAVEGDGPTLAEIQEHGTREEQIAQAQRFAAAVRRGVDSAAQYLGVDPSELVAIPEPVVEVIALGGVEIELKSLASLTEADRAVIRECPAQLWAANVGDVPVLARALLRAACAYMPLTSLVNELDTLVVEQLAAVLAARLGVE